MPLTPHFLSLAAINHPRQEHDSSLQKSDDEKPPCKYLYVPLYFYVTSSGICMELTGLGGYLAGQRRTLLWGLLFGFGGFFGVGCSLSAAGLGNPFFFWTLKWLNGESHSKDCEGEYHGIIVTQKYLTIFILVIQ
jgi:hypothetical protein